MTPPQVPEGATPLRLRVLDLPFTAVEWALPGDAPALAAATEDRWLTFARSPLARDWASFTGCARLSNSSPIISCFALLKAVYFNGVSTPFSFWRVILEAMNADSAQRPYTLNLGTNLRNTQEHRGHRRSGRAG